MSGIFAPSRVRDTKLWQHLATGYATTSHATTAVTLAENVAGLCELAENRIKGMPALHPEFTLHDERHLVRVTELMALVVGNALSSLNPLEVGLLILSAYFHDQGMIPEADELKTIETSDDFLLHSQLWRASHSNLTELAEQLTSSVVNELERETIVRKEAELLNAMKTDYVRQTHGPRGAAFIKTRLADDPRLQVAGVHINDVLALLCVSHVLPATDLRPDKGYHYDTLIATFTVNLRYLAVILRLADILDFDKERTPDALFRAIHFTSNVSLAEWEKHRGVQGWTITPDLIRFEMYFSHPVYERLARTFLEWIDNELVSAAEIVRSFPKPFCDRYHLYLPQRVDRSRIGAKDGEYVYHDLEFGLSRDEIVKLLLTEKLYREPSLAIRELVQNSLDALRYRRALYQVEGLDWREGRVEVEHRLDGRGRDVLVCRDNGVGMDELVITNYLTNVGRSYYQSPYFEQERNRFRARGADFDPCSRFGIGFMSCFMIGDHIVIQTRRDYGPGKDHGVPWVVEINGLSGLVVLRRGPDNQAVGTTITVHGRDAQILVDEWSDRIQLVKRIHGICLAVEFPIRAVCKVNGIEESYEVPVGPYKRLTELEVCHLIPFRTFEESFAKIDPRLNGTIRESFLVDDRNMPVVANKAAGWVRSEKERSAKLQRADGSFPEVDYRMDKGQVCCDGILVAGEPGRDGREHLWGTVYPDQMGLDSPFVLDVRGEIKPELTAARTPPEHDYQGPSWERLRMMVRLAHGRLWEQVLALTDAGLSSAEFWKLACIYNMRFPAMRRGAIWNYLALPFKKEGADTKWKKVSDLREFSFDESEVVEIPKFGKMVAPEEVTCWERKENGASVKWDMQLVLVQMATLVENEKSVSFELTTPSSKDLVPEEFRLRSRFDWGAVLIPYRCTGEALLSAQSAMRTANRNHPLVEIALRERFSERGGPLEEFARVAVACFSDKDTLKAMAVNVHKPTRWMRYVARMYLAIDWNRVSSSLRAPYPVWTEGRGRVVVTEAVIEEWTR